MWFRVETGFVDHWKLDAAAERLGGRPRDRGRVVTTWLELMSYTVRKKTDGFIPLDVARRLRTDSRPARVLDAMCAPDVRLLIREPKGYRVNHFHEYQPTAARLFGELDPGCGKPCGKPVVPEQARAQSVADSDHDLYAENSRTSRVRANSLSKNSGNVARGLLRSTKYDLTPTSTPIPVERSRIVRSSSTEENKSTRDRARALTFGAAKTHLMTAALHELDRDPDALDSTLAEIAKTTLAKMECFEWSPGDITEVLRAARRVRERQRRERGA